MKVAARCSQHSPMFGQWASSHTVWSLSSRIRCFRARWLGPPGAGTLSHAGLRGLRGERGVAMRLGEDSEVGEGAKGRNSTRRLIALPGLRMLQTAQFLFQFRIRRQHAVRDLGDLLGFAPPALELRDLGLLVDRHFEREAPLRCEAAQE